LATYCGKDARLFKCPADQFLSAVQRTRGLKERVRSISQNPYAATSNIESGPASDPAFVHVTTLTGLLNPKPAETWVSIDEHPDSINDGVLVGPTTTAWWDLPANQHDGGASVAFADGSAEIHRWQGSVLKYPVTFVVFSSTIQALNDPDLQWLRYRTPRKPGTN
jgi:prepilin-type processing-associated H-X9-DG protein